MKELNDNKKKEVATIEVVLKSIEANRKTYGIEKPDFRFMDISMLVKGGFSDSTIIQIMEAFK